MMRRILYSFFIVAGLLCANIARAQYQPLLKIGRSRDVISFKKEGVDDEIRLVCVNNSNMDFVMRFKGNNRTYAIRPGDNVLEQIPLRAIVEKDMTRSMEQFQFLPGRQVSESKVGKVVYALPVKDGATVRCKLRSERVVVNRTDTVRVPSMQFAMSEGDPIYAVRTGTVCLVAHEKLVSFYVYHEDGSFTFYNNIDTNLEEGQRVKVGDFVGTKTGNKPFKMFFFHYDTEMLKTIKLPYKTFSPKFRTSNGDILLEDKCEYKAVVDEGLKKQGM